jgi:hydrogenase nickel incorporation protein HypB
MFTELTQSLTNVFIAHHHGHSHHQAYAGTAESHHHADHDHDHDHNDHGHADPGHTNDHDHHHHHDLAPAKPVAVDSVAVMAAIYDENDRIAIQTNHKLSAAGILTVNVMGSPGAGKTSSIIALIR